MAALLHHARKILNGPYSRGALTADKRLMATEHLENLLFVFRYEPIGLHDLATLMERRTLYGKRAKKTKDKKCAVTSSMHERPNVY